MSPWIYDNQEMLDISQFPKNTFGFVYRINHLPTDKSYIGKKVLYHNRKTKLGKKELVQYEGLVGRKPVYAWLPLAVLLPVPRTELTKLTNNSLITWLIYKRFIRYQSLF